MSAARYGRWTLAYRAKLSVRPTNCVSHKRVALNRLTRMNWRLRRAQPLDEQSTCHARPKGSRRRRSWPGCFDPGWCRLARAGLRPEASLPWLYCCTCTASPRTESPSARGLLGKRVRSTTRGHGQPPEGAVPRRVRRVPQGANGPRLLGWSAPFYWLAKVVTGVRFPRWRRSERPPGRSRPYTRSFLRSKSYWLSERTALARQREALAASTGPAVPSTDIAAFDGFKVLEHDI